MNNNTITEEYIKKFPDGIKNCLTNIKYKNRFISNVTYDYDDIVVYRGIHRKEEISEDDFIGNIEEAELYKRNPLKESLEAHAVSVNEDPKQIIAALHIPNEKRPLMAVAKGIMRSVNGPADFPVSCDGTPKTHHNWYIFKDKIKSVVKDFKIDNSLLIEKEE